MVGALRHMVILAAALAVTAPASAEKTHERPELFRNLLNCRAITDNAARLACYDQSASALEQAEAKKDLVVVDRKEIRETRKSLFGFTLPKIGLFGGGDKEEGDDKDAITELQSSVQAARMIGGGNWSLSLVDGGTWETMSALNDAPRSGDKVRIKKASLGSYLGQVGINRGVRFRRVE
ncbi:hypothetical protein GG804_21815 [Sphingomonas histidinilytica]|uniref:Uncharacterized protein n=1 Tax=Rhizorhabdus histidinilytica TaxID=439228 RepID=A0A1T5DCR5_9SPHN|nr:hypothetical protein [Rhizorhabdus histidinilytica]MBO9379415.1 hypothetical protein [Rhizorhabdus histidinilytica]SKB69489.1 hypothetical protein SAMN06295920_10598 [Rhizorhabdus histidinilytica]